VYVVAYPAIARHLLMACFAATIFVATQQPAFAFLVTITPGTKALFLQVGNGTFTGTFSAGGTPGNNTTVNKVSVAVPASAVGNGTAQQMSTDSTQTQSPYDAFVFCSIPTEVYVGGFFRIPSGASTASLSVSSPANLQNASGDTIPFSEISWASRGNSDPTPSTIPGGTFNGGTLGIYSFSSNTWAESCHRFSYANTKVVPAGTYTGRVTYTLSAP
jgi:hypothetical protein